MSQVELAALEHDVEAARSKFAHDLARLRSPDTIARFKDELWSEASEAVKGNAQQLFDGLKKRASDNPLATLAIGAGLSWRLFHNPPIASVLVGVGLFGLLRPHPNGQAQNVRVRARELADSAREKMQQWTDEAGSRVRQSTAQFTDGAASIARQTSDAVQEASATVQESASRLGEKAAKAAHDASDIIGEAASDEKVRDNVLLGAAALAVTAALGLAYKRRAHPEH